MYLHSRPEHSNDNMKIQALSGKAQQLKQLRNEVPVRGLNIAFFGNRKNLDMHGRLKDFLIGFRSRNGSQEKHGKSPKEDTGDSSSRQQFEALARGYPIPGPILRKVL